MSKQPQQQQQQTQVQDAVSEEDKHLIALFDEIEGKQLDFLDEAGKGIIERVGTFLAILFAITAFSNNFPPPYLKGNAGAKIMVTITLACCLLAMAAAVFAIDPRKYTKYTNNLTRMRRELDHILKHKARWVRIGGILFAASMVSLAVLILLVIWPL